MELWCAIVFRAKLSAHSKSVIVSSAWIYVIGLMTILALNQAGHGGFTWEGLKSQLPTSSVLAIESRTGGMAIAGISDLTQPARWFLIVLMMIGANSAGTGGGLKTNHIRRTLPRNPKAPARPNPRPILRNRLRLARGLSRTGPGRRSAAGLCFGDRTSRQYVVRRYQRPEQRGLHRFARHGSEGLILCIQRDHSRWPDGPADGFVVDGGYDERCGIGGGLIQKNCISSAG